MSCDGGTVAPLAYIISIEWLLGALSLSPHIIPTLLLSVCKCYCSWQKHTQKRENVEFRCDSNNGGSRVLWGGLNNFKQSSHEKRDEQLCFHCVLLTPSLSCSFFHHLSSFTGSLIYMVNHLFSTNSSILTITKAFLRTWILYLLHLIYRKRTCPRLTFSIFCRMFLLGVLRYTRLICWG